MQKDGKIMPANDTGFFYSFWEKSRFKFSRQLHDPQVTMSSRPKLCEWTCLLHIIWPVGEALGQEICLKWLTDRWQLLKVGDGCVIHGDISVALTWAYHICNWMLRYGLPHESYDVWAYQELPTGGLKCAENSNHMRREAYYYCATVQYYSTVVKNWPTLESNFRPIKTFPLTVLISVIPMTLLYLEPGGRSRAHPDKIYMGRAVGACKMGKISYKMGFSSPRPLKFLVCAYLGHPRVV